MKRVKARKDELVGKSSTSVAKWMRGLENGTVVKGHARFTARNTVEVKGKALTAPQIFLDVGGRPLVPKMAGVDSVPFLTNCR